MPSRRQLLLMSAFLTSLTGAIIGNYGFLHGLPAMAFCGYFDCQVLGLIQLAVVERAFQR